VVIVVKNVLTSGTGGYNMNERIKALAEESGMTQYVATNNKYLERFAELILQDIDRIVDELYHAMPLEQASVLLTLDENIKEHFYGLKK
jgi:DNA-directed RNA polymerase subunit F